MLTVKQAATELGVTIQRVYARVKQESLNAKQIGSQLFIYRDVLFNTKPKRGRPWPKNK